jgi:hypothetical protein
MIEMIFLFLFLHALADFPLQGDFLASFKGKNWIAMTAHCLIWSGVIYFGLKAHGLEQWWHIPFLFFGHMAIDKWKCNRAGNGKELGSDLLIDQLLHFGQIAVCLFVKIN